MFCINVKRLKHKLIKFLIVLSALSLNHVVAEERISFKDGLDAYQKGNYLESRRIWETLAAANDHRAVEFQAANYFGATAARVLHQYGAEHAVVIDRTPIDGPDFVAIEINLGHKRCCGQGG